MANSIDGGSTWTVPENLTDSQTPDCAPGDCDSDHWSTLADRVDENLHIVYTNDRDAGGIAQDEGTVTDNNILYLQWPGIGLDVDLDSNIPHTFALSQNYPNPFNAATSIEYELLEDSHVELLIYDITGAKVAILVNGEMEAGMHSVNWDSGDAASGVYYYSLKANGEESARKMTLLK